jgi:hypothetical protein
MPASRLRLEERAALLVLMAEGRAMSNTEMKQRYGFTIVGQTSKTLTDEKLVTKQKVGRAYTHEITDAGWARCRAEHGQAPGAGGGAMGAAAYALLNAYLTLVGAAPTPNSTPASANGTAHAGPADNVTPASRPTIADSVSVAALTRNGAAPGKSDGRDVAQQIRDAYAKLATGPRAWVSLTALRPLLSANRTDVDDALRAMLRDPDVAIVPESNQKMLTAFDRAAAVRIGSQDKHLIMIEG